MGVAAPVVVNLSLEHAYCDDGWKTALETEMANMNRNTTWSVVPRTSDMRVLPCKCVFSLKDAPDGSQLKKARLVAGGHRQPIYPGDDNYASVAETPHVRLAFALAQHLGLTSRSKVDITAAFLNAELGSDEYVYMETPYPLVDRSVVCKLHRSIYGLRGAPKAWYALFSSSLHDGGLVPSRFDPCLLYRYDHGKLVQLATLHVDDLYLFSLPDTPYSPDLIRSLTQRYKLKELPPTSFVGYDVHEGDDGSILLNQSSFTHKFLSSLGMDTPSKRSVPTPIRVEDVVDPDSLELEEVDGVPAEFNGVPFDYRSVAGSLNYLVTFSRVDLAYAANMISRGKATASRSRGLIKLCAVRYLASHSSLGLHFPSASGNHDDPGPVVISCFVDADHASHPDGRSHTGYVITVNGTPIFWNSSKQTPITLSTVESETVAASDLMRPRPRRSCS